MATKHENVLIDTSTYTIKPYPAQLIEFVKTRGQEKVLFGTNYTMIKPEKALAGLNELELGQTIKDQFLIANAVRIYDLEMKSGRNQVSFKLLSSFWNHTLGLCRLF